MPTDIHPGTDLLATVLAWGLEAIRNGRTTVALVRDVMPQLQAGQEVLRAVDTWWRDHFIPESGGRGRERFHGPEIALAEAAQAWLRPRRHWDHDGHDFLPTPLPTSHDRNDIDRQVPPDDTSMEELHREVREALELLGDLAQRAHTAVGVVRLHMERGALLAAVERHHEELARHDVEHHGYGYRTFEECPMELCAMARRLRDGGEAS